MDVGQIATSIAVVTFATVVFMVLLAAIVRRVLGVPIGMLRILASGVLALGAEVAFEAQFIWNQPHSTVALIPVQLGIIVLVSMLFLVLGELIVPTGTIPDQTAGFPRSGPVPSAAAATRRSPGSRSSTDCSRCAGPPRNPLSRAPGLASGRRGRCGWRWRRRG